LWRVVDADGSIRPLEDSGYRWLPDRPILYRNSPIPSALYFKNKSNPELEPEVNATVSLSNAVKRDLWILPESCLWFTPGTYPIFPITNLFPECLTHFTPRARALKIGAHSSKVVSNPEVNQSRTKETLPGKRFQILVVPTRSPDPFSDRSAWDGKDWIRSRHVWN